MILVSYDIADSKLRTRFARYLKKYGHRLQYSVYEIDNGPHFLATLMIDIQSTWEKQFGEADSVMIFRMSNTCEIMRFGYAKHEDDTLLVI